ncbi:DUF805 domain-containing protein, partial [Ideonella sp. A 288]|uniref:DUF805 domain-containing protein n=1 Tax=Ideonella sp. A 288 TaxID=1962181 RepID=UPI001185EC22
MVTTPTTPTTPSTVRLVFRGELVAGHARDDVMRQVGAALRAEGGRLQQLFSGSRVVLRSGLSAADAERHAAQLATLGALVHIERDQAGMPMPAVAASASRPAPVAVPAPATAAPPDVEQITCPNCGEVQSRRILCRACATDMPMGIAAKLEAAQQSRAQRLDEARARRGLAPLGHGAAHGDEAPSLWGLGWRGRVGRGGYLGVSAALLAAVVLLTGWVLRAPSGGRLGVFTLVMVAVAVFSLRLTVLRLHDVNRSGWWSLGLMVPWLGQLAGVLLAVWPGTRGDNAHGAPPRDGQPLLGAAGVLALGLALVVGGRSIWTSFESGAPGLTLGDPDAGDAPGRAANPPSGGPPTMSAGVAGLPNAEARAGFERDYLPATAHKAFAVSAGGSWGW